MCVCVFVGVCVSPRVNLVESAHNNIHIIMLQLHVMCVLGIIAVQYVFEKSAVSN